MLAIASGMACISCSLNIIHLRPYKPTGPKPNRVMGARSYKKFKRKELTLKSHLSKPIFLKYNLYCPVKNLQCQLTSMAESLPGATLFFSSLMTITSSSSSTICTKNVNSNPILCETSVSVSSVAEPAQKHVHKEEYLVLRPYGPLTSMRWRQNQFSGCSKSIHAL